MSGCCSSEPANALRAEFLKARIYDQVRCDLERIERALQRHLSSSVPLIEVVGRYIVNSGGKRLRPLLMILSARLCGYQGDQEVDLAVAFELLHAATLLHDDVVDNAEIRRKNPAANTIWGNPAVVLIGDYLYSQAIRTTVCYKDLRILEVFSATTSRIAEGEVLQLIHSDDLETDEAAYMEVITRKTADLMTAACQIGAIFAGAGPQEESALRDYGHHLGIAFQLTDDALDYVGSVGELGKPVGNDIQEGKATLPLIHALGRAEDGQRDLIRSAFLSEAPLEREQIEVIQKLVLDLGGVDYTFQKAAHHLDRARSNLGIFPESPAKSTLLDLADYVLCRRS
ncbi:octaprenyl-diphosphate synthase [Desulfacinum hydrothermale DSM 13146]|uniref:Octaprenyl-diphosphate synthase n=1 Tax=Desulfacinum hydrothermale DSM 13146 TaxID=1121390 RepID=A0A1W1XLW8_9BACT|nr:polyprenyl synthetase family protein [Desulfacinum hydrothermale]SMC24541.1 octaprenyl-diphosphate synthase [Desulfacinum hydrothermale DSM 13146]